MALQAQQDICVKCGDIEVTDSTGLYDVTTNPGGYGTPNPNFGDGDPYTVEFFPPKADTSIFILDLYQNPPSPDPDGHYVYTVLKSALGVEVLPSGDWTFKVTLGTDVKTLSCLIYDDIEARITACICQNPKNVQMWADLQAAIALFQCFKNDEAQKIIDRLYKQTECCDCGCS